jgi:protein TonB
MTTKDGLKFSTAMCAALAIHAGALAVTVSRGSAPKFAGHGVSVQFGVAARPAVAPESQDRPVAQAQPEPQHTPVMPPVKAPETPAPSPVPAPRKAAATPLPVPDPVMPAPEPEPNKDAAATAKPEPQAQASSKPAADDGTRGADPSAPDQVHTAHSDSASSAEPESASADPDPAAGAGDPDVGAGNAAETNYAGDVMRHLSRLRRPRASGPGSTHVSFRIAHTGAISHISISRGSGSARFDRDALNFVRKAAPFPRPPGRESQILTVEIEGR